MALNSIQVEWERFWAMVSKGMKPAPSQNQHDEMRKAFFAGAWTIHKATVEIGEPHINERIAMKYLDARERECQQFKAELMREYAERN